MSDTPPVPSSETKQSKFKTSHLIILVLFLFVCFACGPMLAGSNNSSSSSSTAARATAVPRATATLSAPSRLAPTPKPVSLSARGDDVVDITKWRGPALARISHTGSRNFSVTNYNSNGSSLNLLVNTIGPYSGLLPIDFLAAEETSRFEITADGSWEIELVTLDQIAEIRAPGTFSRRGDYVFMVSGSRAVDLLRVDASQASRNFILRAYGNNGSLLVNEIAPYTGTVAVPPSTLLDSGSVILVVEATGEWSIEATTK